MMGDSVLDKAAQEHRARHRARHSVSISFSDLFDKREYQGQMTYVFSSVSFWIRTSKNIQFNFGVFSSVSVSVKTSFSFNSCNNKLLKDV